MVGWQLRIRHERKRETPQPVVLFFAADLTIRLNYGYSRQFSRGGGLDKMLLKSGLTPAYAVAFPLPNTVIKLH